MIREPAVDREVFLLPASSGYRFAIATVPPPPSQRCCLFLHPFAEEMNKSRRMAAAAARAIAAEGWLVLQIDLCGCGDSSGDFGDASWAAWIADVSLGWTWLRERCRATPVIWTLRAGSLLAADWIARTGAQPPLLMWQPVASGKQHLAQFLRLKAAHEMLGASDASGGTAALRKALDAGDSVEVAGYLLSPELASGLSAASFRLPDDYRGAVAILEITSRAEPQLSPAIEQIAQRARDCGARVRADVVTGPAFWQTQEIESVPSLVPASLEALRELVR